MEFKFLTIGNSRTDTLCPVFFNDRLRHPERSVNYFVTDQRKKTAAARLSFPLSSCFSLLFLLSAPDEEEGQGAERDQAGGQEGDPDAGVVPVAGGDALVRRGSDGEDRQRLAVPIGHADDVLAGSEASEIVRLQLDKGAAGLGGIIACRHGLAVNGQLGEFADRTVGAERQGDIGALAPDAARSLRDQIVRQVERQDARADEVALEGDRGSSGLGGDVVLKAHIVISALDEQHVAVFQHDGGRRALVLRLAGSDRAGHAAARDGCDREALCHGTAVIAQALDRDGGGADLDVVGIAGHLEIRAGDEIARAVAQRNGGLERRAGIDHLGGRNGDHGRLDCFAIKRDGIGVAFDVRALAVLHVMEDDLEAVADVGQRALRTDGKAALKLFAPQ